jgi:hypothetical protein
VRETLPLYLWAMGHTQDLFDQTQGQVGEGASKVELVGQVQRLVLRTALSRCHDMLKGV